MARGTRLDALIRMVRLETGQSVQPGQGLQNRDHIAHGLKRTQEQLYSDFDWPQLRVWRYETLFPGSFLYTWPEDIDLEDVRQLYDRDGEQWRPVPYGIDFALRNRWPVEQRSDPVRAWQEVGAREYEILPVPAVGRQLAIEGYQRLKPLVQDSDIAVLDDNMLVLFFAAEWLARNKMADAQAKLGMAQRLKAKLQGRLVSDKRRNVIPLVGGVSPNAVHLGPNRRAHGLPPPTPKG